jgi:hypothetical protein
MIQEGPHCTPLPALLCPPLTDLQSRPEPLRTLHADSEEHHQERASVGPFGAVGGKPVLLTMVVKQACQHGQMFWRRYSTEWHSLVVADRGLNSKADNFWV